MIIVKDKYYSNPYDKNNDNKKMNEWTLMNSKNDNTTTNGCGNKDNKNRNYKNTSNNHNDNNRDNDN